MIDTEDSVVTSLNELRKLKNERRQTRQRGNEPRSQAALAKDSVSDEFTTIDQASNESTPRPGQTHAAVSQPAPAFATYAPAPAVVFQDHRSTAIPQSLTPPKSSAKPAIIVAALLIGAGAFGYVKLQNETQAILAAKSVEVRDAEDGRNKAIESLARTEQLAKTNLRQCEDKLKLAMAASPSRSAPAIAPSDSSPSRSSKPTIARSSSRSPRRVAAAAPAEPATPKASAVPNIAKRKVILDDPLAGLGKP